MPALHDLLVHDINESLAEHDSKRCLVCTPETNSQTADHTDNDFFVAPQKPQQQQPNPQQPSLMNKLSSVFKTRSAEMKEKLVEYITNPNGEALAVERHVSPQDRDGPLYRNQGNVFRLSDDDERKWCSDTYWSVGFLG